MQHTNPEITDPRIRTAVAIELSRTWKAHRRIITQIPPANDAIRIASHNYFIGVLNGIRFAADEISDYLNRHPQQ